MASNDKFDPSVASVRSQQTAEVVAPARRTRSRPRQSASAADESEELRAIFDNARVGIAQTDLYGRFLLVNREYCAIVGRPVHELMALRLQNLLPDHQGDEPESLEKLIAQAEAVESAYVRADGAEIWLSHAISLVTDADGTPRCAVAVVHDITSRKRSEDGFRRREETFRQHAEELEQQLIASGRLVSLGELTASMAHEFNNPLGIILGFTEDLMSDMDPADPNYRSLQIIDEEARRCEKIVKDLLEFARPRSADFTRTDVSEVIKKTMEMISSRVFKQKVEAVSDIAPDLPPIHADAQQLQQVLANLCLNALDAMPDGGKLTIRAHRRFADQLVISVTDSGFGMDHETRSKIFQPFFTAKKRKGLGLGLPISQRIVKAHGGSVEVKSEPNRGATFTICLPVQSAPETAPA